MLATGSPLLSPRFLPLRGIRFAAAALLQSLLLAPGLHAQAWTLDPRPTPLIEHETLLPTSTFFAPLADGRLLAYGDFTHVNGTRAPALARVDRHGTVDPTVTNPFGGTERPVIVAPLGSGGYIAVLASAAGRSAPGPLALGGLAGTFGIVPPTVPATPQVVPSSTPTVLPTLPVGPASRLARLQADGRLDATTLPLACDGPVQLLPLADGRMLVWGTFRTLGGVARNSLARLNADGSLDAAFAPVIAPFPIAVRSAAAASDHAVVISGHGYDAQGQTRYFFTRIAANGVVDARFAPPPATATFAFLAVQSDGGVLAGNYTLVRYTASGAVDLGYQLRIPGLKSLNRVAPLQGDRLVVEAAVGPANNFGAPVVFTIDRGGNVETDVRTLPGATNAQQLRAILADESLLLLESTLRVVAAVVTPVTTTSTHPDPIAAVTSPPSDVTATALPVLPPGSVYSPLYTYPALTQSSLVVRSVRGGEGTRFGAAFGYRSRGLIDRIEPDAAGRALISGTFTHLDGQPRPGLARINADGTLDRGFVPPAGTLLAAPPDGRPVVNLADRVARLRDDGSIDPDFTFPAELRREQTKWLACADGRFLISTFEPDDSSEANLKLMWLDENGRRLTTLPTRFGGFGYFVYPVFAFTSLTTTTTAGGATTTATTTPQLSTSDIVQAVASAANSAVATTTAAPVAPGDPSLVTSGAVPGVTTTTSGSVITTTGTTTGTTIVPIPTATVIAYPRVWVVPHAIRAGRVLPGGRLLLTGSFRTADGAPREGRVLLNADGSVDGAPPVAVAAPTGGQVTAVTVAIVPPIPPPYALPLPDGRALVFTTAWEDSRLMIRVARLRSDGTADPAFQPPPNLLTMATEVVGTDLLFSNGRLYDLDAVLDRNFAPELRLGGLPAQASTAALGGRTLWIAGNFDRVNGGASGGLARLTSSEIKGITFGPASRTVVANREVVLDVVLGTHDPATYQWTRDGVAVAGATGASLRLAAVTAADAGAYRVRVTLDGQTHTSAPAVVAVTPNFSRLVNFSARSRVDAASPQIAGFVGDAPAPRRLLLRAVGFGVPGSLGAPVLRVPVLTLHDGGQATAEDRGGVLAPAIVALARQVGAFPIDTSRLLPPPNTLMGSALAPTLGRGSFTAVTSTGDGQAGVSLFELYDTASTSAPPLLRNLAIRGQTAPGAEVLTAGFVIAGNGPLRLLIRAVGPALGSFGVNDAVADPILQVFAGGARGPLATNDQWEGDAAVAAAASAVQAFPLAPGSRDAALLLTLEPGTYTVQLVAARNATGNGLLEIYDIRD